MVNTKYKRVLQMLESESADSLQDRAWNITDDDITKSLLRITLDDVMSREIDLLTANSPTFQHRLEDLKWMLEREGISTFEEYKAFGRASFDRFSTAFASAAQETGYKVYPLILVGSNMSKSEHNNVRVSLLKIELSALGKHISSTEEQSQRLLDASKESIKSSDSSGKTLSVCFKNGDVIRRESVRPTLPDFVVNPSKLDIIRLGKGLMEIGRDKSVFLKSNENFDITVVPPVDKLLSPDIGGQQSSKPEAFLDKGVKSMKVDKTSKKPFRKTKHSKL